MPELFLEQLLVVALQEKVDLHALGALCALVRQFQPLLVPHFEYTEG